MFFSGKMNGFSDFLVRLWMLLFCWSCKWWCISGGKEYVWFIM